MLRDVVLSKDAVMFLVSAGISVHKSPIDKTLRVKWKAFVGTHCAHFKPDGRFAVCSDHFTPDSFEWSQSMWMVLLEG